MAPTWAGPGLFEVILAFTSVALSFIQVYRIIVLNSILVVIIFILHLVVPV